MLFRSYRDNKLPRGPHFLYGLDADLIILSLLSPLPDIYLVREDERSINYLNIQKMREYLNTNMKTSTSLQDFSLIMSLIGNDFLPHNIAFNAIDIAIRSMLQVYKEPLTDFKTGEILWPNFRIYLEKVQDIVVDLLKNDAPRSKSLIKIGRAHV